MGATNTTTHYELSQFVSTDKPAWLQDYNGDMAKIDAGIDAAKVAADTAQLTANNATSASTQNTNDITALQTDVSGIGLNVTSLQSAVNTINSLIGNGTPTTTDQTIIGAINEIHGALTVEDEITATTSANGNLHTGIQVTSALILMARGATTNAQDVVCMPFVAVNGEWLIRCVNSAGQPIANASLSIKFVKVS